MIDLTEEKAKKILSYLDDWVLESDSTSLDSDKVNNNIVSFTSVKNHYEDVFVLTEIEINSQYEILEPYEQESFLIAVYKKTALELWSTENFNSGDSEEEQPSSLDKVGRKLFAEYKRITDNLRNQTVIYGIY
jgi:hypothetical protein